MLHRRESEKGQADGENVINNPPFNLNEAFENE